MDFYPVVFTGLVEAVSILVVSTFLSVSVLILLLESVLIVLVLSETGLALSAALLQPITTTMANSITARADKVCFGFAGIILYDLS